MFQPQQIPQKVVVLRQQQPLQTQPPQVNLSAAQPSAATSGLSSNANVEYYSIRLPRASDAPTKKYSVLKFSTLAGLNFDSGSSTKVKLERENNYKEFKMANDMELMPKTGAGSEFGREQRELARRKKYGRRIHKYNPRDQPLLMNVISDADKKQQSSNGEKSASGKTTRRFKGVKDGGVSENASYFVFTQVADKTFEACPVEDWYHFTPLAKYKVLSSEEAEAEFERRDKTVNLFSIMVKKRLKNEDDGEGDDDEGEGGKGKGKKKSGKSAAKSKSLTLTEFDEWADMSDEDDDDDSDADKKDDDDGDSKKKKKSKEGRGRAARKQKQKGSDDEASEESDEQDEGEEVDYMSGSSSDNEDMYDDKDRDDTDKYKEGGVIDEEGGKKFVDSDEDEENEEEEQNQDDEDLDDDIKDKKDSDSSDDSDSDSDLDNLESAGLLLKTEKKKKTSDKKSSNTGEGGSGSSQSQKNDAGSSSADNTSKKRKSDSPAPSSAAKKAKAETSSAAAASASTTTRTGDVGGITEDLVRRYLLRKQMTTQELLRKLKSVNTSLSSHELVSVVGQILKKINPQKIKKKDTLYLYLNAEKKPSE